MKGNKGVALILAVGILAVLAAIATSFALNMRLEYKAASNYYEGVKARYLAGAALQHAIAKLKEEVKSNAFDYLSEEWAGSSPSYENDLDGDGVADATSSIVDEQRKVNLNNGKQLLITNLLTLCEVAGAASVCTDKILPNRPYANLQELKSKAGLTDAEYNAIKDYVTVTSYGDVNVTGAPSEGRSPVNVNTASLDVLKSVLRIGTVPENIADVVAQKIHNRVNPSIGNTPFTSWSQFNQYIDNLTLPAFPDYVSGFTAIYAGYVKNNCNPNKTETADKITTEFCFNSGGYYSITATGTAGGAKRILNAVVKIYDIKNYTTKTQFATGGNAARVTWLDSCPVNSNALFGDPTTFPAAQVIEGSIKLGYWDNFEEDSAYSANQWLNETVIQNGQGVDGTYALVGTEGTACSLWNSTAGWDWMWDNFSLRVYSNEYDISSASQMKDVAWVVLREDNGSAPFTDAPSVMHTRNGVLSWDNTGYGYLNSTLGLSGEEGEVTFMTVEEYMAQTGYGEEEAISDRHRYGSGQVRIFSSYANDTNEDYDNSTYSNLLAYNQIKTFNIRATGSTISVDAWNGAGTRVSPYPFSRTVSGANTSGRLVLFSNNVKAGWDNIRIIPDDGKYTSQIISPTGSDVRWATITGTITHPDSAGGDAGDILLRTSLGGLTTVGPYVDLDTTSSTGPFLTLDSSASSIQFGATLTTTSPYQETPVLEDVTITYLPKTEIVSYSFSQ